ncbi:hypothetical protein FHW79_005982 [Azospirillum sp. OGB3]|uniref:hypothetical protein n=1 Tax=Azospirillum sp. OGB3 TaxID=2587012 RepID=UPI0016059A47|nr:hypothetical protein [Azospirillum sp. OGB3]MBB3268307.1 hypothetical protein [Azospirillum sp. OGB3]
MMFFRTLAAGILLAAAGSAAASTSQNPWKSIEAATQEVAVAKRDMTIILRVLASSVSSTEFTVAMMPLTAEVKARYRSQECLFYEEVTNTPFAANPYFAPIAGQIVQEALPPEFYNNKVVGKLASYLAYMAATNDPPACVCEPMPVKEVIDLCRKRYYPAVPEDQARYDKAMGRP